MSAEGNRVLECVLHVHNHISIGRYEQWWQVVGWEWWWWWWWVLLRKGTASGSGAHNGLIVMMVERIGVQRAIKC